MRIVGFMDAIGMAKGAMITERLAMQIQSAAARLAGLMKEELEE